MNRKQFNLILLLIITGLLCSCNFSSLSAADTSLEIKKSNMIEKQDICVFDQIIFPDNMAIFAAVGYSGRKTGFQIDQSGHEVTLMDVIVNLPNRPVALMLGDHEPTIWNLSWTEGTRIVAILVSGYYRQVLAGVDESVPVLNSTFSNQGSCGYFYMSPEKQERINSISQRLFKRPVKAVYLAEEGQVVIGELTSHQTQLLTNTEIPPELFYDSGAPLAGHAGLQEAVKQGVLRVATSEDAREWDESFRKHKGEGDLLPIVNQTESSSSELKIELRNAYVVLKEFIFPAGLYGANSATFFVPNGIPRPKGNPGHSSVCDYNTLVNN